MGLFTYIEKLINEHGSAKILKERLSVVGDQFAESERKNSVLQSENAILKAALENERLKYQKTQQEFQRLRKEQEEEVHISHGIEFRRGKRTGNQWVAFCPKCHMPASIAGNLPPACSDSGCHWTAEIGAEELLRIMKEF